MESVLVKVVSFIAVIVVGYLLKRVGFFRAEDFRLIAGLVLKVTLPCAIISNFTRIDVDAALFVLVLLGLGCNLVTVAAGWLASKRGDSAEQAFNIINFSGYNVGCFALPFLQSFVSPMGVVAACIWDTGNSIMCTGATYSIAAAVAGKNEGGGARLFLQADVFFCSDGCLCRHDDSGFPRLEASAAGAGVYRHGGRSKSVPCHADDRHRL